MMATSGDHAQPTPGPMQLTLRLEFEEHSVRGTITGEDRVAQPFVGWLGLLSSLERYRSTAPSTPGTVSSPGAGGCA